MELQEFIVAVFFKARKGEWSSFVDRDLTFKHANMTLNSRRKIFMCVRAFLTTCIRFPVRGIVESKFEIYFMPHNNMILYLPEDARIVRYYLSLWN